MIDTHFEDAFKKAKSVILKCSARYEGYRPEIPGTITLIYEHDSFLDAAKMYAYLQNDFADNYKTIQIKQTAIDKVTITLLIESDPPIILVIPNLNCRANNIEYFFKWQREDKPLLFKIEYILPKNGGQKIVADILNAGADADIHHPIQINSSKGSPLGTSSGEETSL
ncbi:MAG: hypothetical protein ACXVBN_16955 [Flavisolibacter sp.]